MKTVKLNFIQFSSVVIVLDSQMLHILDETWLLFVNILSVCKQLAFLSLNLENVSNSNEVEIKCLIMLNYENHAAMRKNRRTKDCETN